MPLVNTLIIGADHGGYDHKKAIVSWLGENEPLIAVHDIGTHTRDSIDYPVIAQKTVEAINDEFTHGILVCGSGIGMSMVANRHPGIRAAVVTDPTSALLARAHNNANVLCLGARITTVLIATAIIRAWLLTAFDGGRHLNRIQQF